MNKYAVLIEVDDDVMYVSDENPFGYNSTPKVFSNFEEAMVAACCWKTGRVVIYPVWDEWHEGEIGK